MFGQKRFTRSRSGAARPRRASGRAGSLADLSPQARRDIGMTIGVGDRFWRSLCD